MLTPLNMLEAHRFTDPYQAQYFRAALDAPCKQLLLDYLRELDVRLVFKPKSNQSATVLAVMRFMNNLLVLKAHTHTLTSDMHQLHMAVQRDADVISLIDIVSASECIGIGILYDVMPVLPYWRELKNTNFKYYERASRDLMLQYYYCGYSRHTAIENDIDDIITAETRSSWWRAAGASVKISVLTALKYTPYVCIVLAWGLMIGHHLTRHVPTCDEAQAEHCI